MRLPAHAPISVFAMFVCACSAGKARAGGEGELVTSLETSLAPLKQHFNRDKDRIRFVTLLSST